MNHDLVKEESDTEIKNESRALYYYLFSLNNHSCLFSDRLYTYELHFTL